MSISKEEFYDRLSGYLQIKVADDMVFFDQTGLSGADAFEFISWLHGEFGISFSNFDYREYFVADGDNFIRLMLDAFYKTRKIPRKNFTAQHLYEVIKAGYWFPW